MLEEPAAGLRYRITLHHQTTPFGVAVGAFLDYSTLLVLLEAPPRGTSSEFELKRQVSVLFRP